MNTGSRNLNYFILGLVLVVSALLAKGYLRSPQKGPMLALQQDLKRSLDAFWQTDRCQAEVLGAPAAAEVRVGVWPPSGARPRQRAWSLPLVAFIAARYPEVKPGALEVRDLTTGQALQNQSLSQSQQDQSREAVVGGGGFADPAYFEAAQAELLQRNAQRELDNAYGPGSTLVLVEVWASGGEQASATGPNTNSAAPPLAAEQKVAERQGAPFVARRRAPHGNTLEAESALAPAPRPSQPQLARIEAHLILLEQSRVQEASGRVRTALGLVEGRGDTLRALVLGPKL